MQKLRFFFLLLLFPSILFAQQRTKIELVSSDRLTVDTKTNVNYVINPVFRQDNATLRSDSAVFYKDRNYFEAFKNVHINQGDTVNIYSDFLNYDGNAKKAHLSNNVKMIDPTSTLTTNILDYNMATKIGEYSTGGKIVNKDVVLTSKRGYYFANTKDAYFRYNVVVVTPQSTIKSDTLRYNTFTNWTYFYGPTNIKGKDDNLYTENGAYNTKSENAYFGKKNLYTQNTKSLRGDSLYYYGKTGYGRAVKNIVFIDTSDRTLLRGQLGEYYKADERVVVTRNAYFGMATKDSITVNNKKIPDTLWLGADTLETQKVLQHKLKLLNKPIIQKDNEVGAEDEKAKEEKEKEKAKARKAAAAAQVVKKPAVVNLDTKKLSKKERKLAEQKAKDLKNNPPPPKLLDSTKVNTDSFKTDSLKKMLPLPTQNKTIIPSKKDSVQNDKKIAAKSDDKKAIPTAVNGIKPKIASTNQLKKDSVAVFNPSDTVRTRVIKAFHNVRVYKSNMQAKADSLFYTAADSTLRWYKNPILWSEGTQQTGDTIHVFFKNDKIHSFQVLQNGFLVNVETDSTKFNQVKGKKITGFFKEGELRNMYVDGNAESIYYSKDDKGNYDKMNQSVSSRIKFLFKDKELTDILYIKEAEGATNPMNKLPKETTLTGFIWKPELRPVSKADIIKGKPVPKPTSKNTTTKPAVKVKGNDPSGIKPILPSKKPTTENPNKGKTTPIKPAVVPPVKVDTTKRKFNL
ncbi:MAG: OstA-like protein [Pedobacter sp.]|uniref:OstA-like protein n=1 Tax=Pedobacter sp. TaxID=1411316 RepID=UPI003565F626